MKTNGFRRARIARITPPRLQTLDESRGRTATWLELFYDLAFVVVVAVLGQRLHDDISWSGLASFGGYFALLWWLWVSHTFYADRYDTDDLVYRLLAMAQMLAVLVIAAALTAGPAESTVAFSAGYATARLVLLAMYVRVYRHVTETRYLVGGYLIGFGLAAALWTTSIFAPEPSRFALWAVALTVDLATPWLMRRQQAEVPLDVSHLPERFGLFTILVMGESLAAVMVGLGHHHWSWGSVLGAALGVGLTTTLWWLYFDNAEGSVVRRRDTDRRTWRPTAWIYAHLPLAAALAALGVALEHIVTEVGDGRMDPSLRWLLVGAVIIALSAMALTQLASLGHPMGSLNRAISLNRLAALPILLVIGVLGRPRPLVVVLGVLGVCVAVLIADLWAWDREDDRG
ncbi:MAG TPA: low temperature requirement protein A [Acidimicrobiia bacterium]|nr:low temperature requirement protein A [Acidimicrobiia bacterium]